MSALRTNDTQRIESLFVFIALTVTAAAIGLIWLYPLLPHEPLPSISLIVESLRPSVSPKPVEQFVFVAIGTVTPLYTFLLVVASKQNTLPVLLTRFPFLLPGLPILVTAMLFGPFVGSEFVTVLIGEFQKPQSDGLPRLLMSTLVAAITISAYVESGIRSLRFFSTRSMLVGVWIVFVTAVFLQIFSWRLVSLASTANNGAWSVHFDAAIYVLSQVVAGKTVLVDLPSQYGLFPEIVAPLFCWIGLTVFTFTAFFAVLQFISMAAIFYVLTRFVRIKPLLIAAGLALVMVTFETVLHFADFEERYFQYWPIRFFWPAVSVLVFYWYTLRPGLMRSAGMSVTGAIALLWNVDSGLFVSLAFAVFLVARLARRLLDRHRASSEAIARGTWTASTYTYAIFLHIAITCGVIAMCFAVLTWKGHHALNYFWLFEYQKLFYGLGFAMLPLPLNVSPWMSVLGLYLIGLICASIGWRRRVSNIRDDLIFYLSMLGLGLFVYYEGRSHVLNLISVCWPGVMIVAILADKILRAIGAGLVPRWQVCAPIAAASVLFLAAATFIAHVPVSIRQMHQAYVSRGVPVDPVVQSEIAFIKHYAPGSECAIIANKQGIFYAEANLRSPIPGPGLVEMLREADIEDLRQTLKNGRLSCIFFGIGQADAGVKITIPELMAHYVLAAKNNENTMLFLQLRSVSH
jgi:hypothetical protein